MEYFTDYPILQKMIDQYEKLASIHIHIEDIAHVSDIIPMMQISNSNKTHSLSRPVCKAALKSETLREKCVQNKDRCLERCHTERGGFVNTCHMGILQIIQPVFFMEKLICVIILEGLANDEEPYISSYMKASSFKEDYSLIVQAYKGLRRMTDDFLPDARELLSIIYSTVIMILEKNVTILKEYLKHNTGGIVQTVTEYVSANFKKRITLTNVAKIYNVNYNYLSQLFKKEMGIPFIEYVMKLKIEEAKMLLLYTSKSVTEISYELSFNDAAHFCKVFKKHTGYAPSLFKDHYGTII
jgi:AraC-like DNA-binding protein